MKRSVFQSLLMHLLLVAVLLVWRSGPHPLPKTAIVYQVALVSMPLVTEKFSVKAETETPIKKVETLAKTPKKAAVSPRPKTKEEPQLKEAKTTENTGSSRVTIDTQDFPFAYYLNLLRYRVQENWQPPYQNIEQSEKISAVVGFRVLRNGQIVDIILEKTSGRFLFDQASQRAVHFANPLPPLPEEFIGEHLSVHIEFEGIW